jgi:hypothetical protein
LPLLFFARVEIARIHYGIQRIASYIRVVLEEDGKNPNLRWENASYDIRLASVGKLDDQRTRTIELEEQAQERKEGTNKPGEKLLWDVSTLYPMDRILYTSGWLAFLLATFLPWLPQPQSTSPPPFWPFPVSVYVALAVTAVWLGLWYSYSRRLRELEEMEVDRREADFLRKWEKDRRAKSSEGTANG